MQGGGGHRRNRSVGGAFEAIREGAIFECFLLVGLDSQTLDVCCISFNLLFLVFW
jgi:hypothetical protein